MSLEAARPRIFSFWRLVLGGQRNVLIEIDEQGIVAHRLKLRRTVRRCGHPGRISTAGLYQVFYFHIRALPRIAELAFDEARVVVLVLSLQRLLQSEQRARISWIAIKVRPEDFFGARRIAIDQQRAA